MVSLYWKMNGCHVSKLRKICQTSCMAGHKHTHKRHSIGIRWVWVSVAHTKCMYAVHRRFSRTLGNRASTFCRHKQKTPASYTYLTTVQYPFVESPKGTTIQILFSLHGIFVQMLNMFQCSWYSCFISFLVFLCVFVIYFVFCVCLFVW